MGNRPVELARLIASVRTQQGAPIEIVVVVNGALPEGAGLDLPPTVKLISLPENLGIPAGRNVGAEVMTSDVLLFLDDDGWWPDQDSAQHLRRAFAADAHLGAVSFRIIDPVSGVTQRRHVPRLRVGDPNRSSAVTTFLGGAVAIRRTAFEEAGGLPGLFFYGHEETDLAWRLMDRGWSLTYDGEVAFCHPLTSPARHATYFHNGARNRVWLARRNLPAVLVPVYLAVWIALTHLRTHDREALRAWWGGFRVGLSGSCGVRQPMRWRTVLAMTRAGRPPVV